MGRILTIDEMLDVVTAMPGEDGAAFVSRVEAIGTELAQYIARTLGIECTEATFEGTAFAGTCSSFSPAHPDQTIPDELEFYDEGGDWEF